MEIDTHAAAASVATPDAAAAAPAASAASAVRIVFPGDQLTVSGTGIRLGNGLVQASLVTRPGAAASPAPAAASSAAATAAAVHSSLAAAAAVPPPQGSALVTKCGVLRKGANGKLWVDNVQKRFQPGVDDLVVGTVVEAHAESYRVDIGTSQPALLPALAFEGATKRNKPNLPLGALVYARVVVCNKDVSYPASFVAQLARLAFGRALRECQREVGSH